jgi:hypothetical protein
MFFRLMYQIVLPIYVVFVIFSSITLGRSQNDFLIILIGILFITSIMWTGFIFFTDRSQYVILTMGGGK